jgi:hypothetical protein
MYCQSFFERLKRQEADESRFLPPIGDDFGVYNVDKKPQSNRKGPGWQDGWHAEQWPKPDRQRRDILINVYSLPEWFFQNMGWNANGFFGSSIRPSKEKLIYGELDQV